MTRLLLPRTKSITSLLTPEERLPLLNVNPEELRLPPQILAVTGPATRRLTPHYGRCGITLVLENNDGKRFVLKIVRGAYRIQELLLEQHVLQALQGTSIPAPRPRAVAQAGSMAFLLMDQMPGRPVSDVLREATSADDRNRIASAIGAMLADIHHLATEQVTWQECIDGQLAWAMRYLEKRVMSRAEFRAKGIIGDPAHELDHLRATCPAPGTVAVLHGDFRPKNILWDGERITAVLDWTFADLGDPWYDLGTAFGYLEPDGQKVLLTAYGLNAVDEERLAWFRALAVYLAV